MGRVALGAATVACVVVGVLIGQLARAASPSSAPVRLPIAASATTEMGSIVVAKGDHLWKISASHLRDVMGRDPANTEIGPYWRRVILENTSRLRSGDPDLIYPGEVVILPGYGG